METLTRPETQAQAYLNQVPFGPLVESGQISAGLDFYKPNMSQVLYEHEPDAIVTFTFKNRGEQRLADYVNPVDLQARFDCIQQRGFSEQELDFYAVQRRSNGQPLYAIDFIEYLADNQLPPVSVRLDQETDDIAIETTGPADLVTFWETVVMSEINESYFENYVTAHGLDLMEIYDEGERRLSDKIALLQAHPEIKISDFGTRRHFSLRWQRYVLGRLAQECPGNLLGTSNIALADSLNLKPIGTFAHEIPMIWAGLADVRDQNIRASHHDCLETWREVYGKDLSVALTDTFTSEFFFEDFTAEQANTWQALRHDSGDPIIFGERAIAFYEDLGIDPKTKTIVFSDGLKIDDIIALNAHFGERIGTMYGWGTSLMNDLGIPALNIVMKATHVRLPDGREADLVKLSDNNGKHTGPAEKIAQYEEAFAAKA